MGEQTACWKFVYIFRSSEGQREEKKKKEYTRPSSGNREVSSSQMFGDQVESRVMGFGVIISIVVFI